jgi:hypothetical protein
MDFGGLEVAIFIRLPVVQPLARNVNPIYLPEDR